MSYFVTGALSAVREANEINFAIASGRPPRRASIAANLFSASGLKLPALPCMFSTPAGPLGSGRALWLMHQRLRLDCSCHSGTHMCRQEFPGQNRTPFIQTRGSAKHHRNRANWMSRGSRSRRRHHKTVICRRDRNAVAAAERAQVFNLFFRFATTLSPGVLHKPGRIEAVVRSKKIRIRRARRAHKRSVVSSNSAEHVLNAIRAAKRAYLDQSVTTCGAAACWGCGGTLCISRKRGSFLPHTSLFTLSM
jgi:hypothetical protein